MRADSGVIVPSVLAALAGVALMGLAIWQLSRDQASAPGFVATLAYVVLLLIGVALTYLGIERSKDARNIAGGSDRERRV